MNERDVAFLRRLIGDGATERKNDGTAARMAETEGVGKATGSKVLYTEVDHKRARNILATRGFDLEAKDGPFKRSEAPRGGSEKTRSLNVTDGMVACRGVRMDQDLKISGDGYCSLRWQDAMALRYDVLLVCENLETLIELDHYKWLSRYYKDRSVMALFRGTKTWYTTGAAAELIRNDTRPTLAFFDFDPKGLAMAASLPRREVLCLPDMDVLEQTVLHYRRRELFTKSADLCRPQLDKVTDTEIREAWSRMKKITFGLNQEQFPRN